VEPITLAWWTAGLAGVVALAALLWIVGEERRNAAQRVDAETVRKELRALRKDLEQRAKHLRQSEAEVDRLTRQAGKAQKQAASGKRGARGERVETDARIGELEEAAQRASEEIARLERELERVDTQSAVASKHAARAEVALERGQREAEASEASRIEVTARAEASAIDELTRRVEAAEAALGERDAALAAAGQETKRLKGKVRTQDTLYLSLRGELAVKKDQVKQQREELERLRAFRVALAPEMPARPAAEEIAAPEEDEASAAPPAGEHPERLHD
jgi:chromosome segregation ATPase